MGHRYVQTALATLCALAAAPALAITVGMVDGFQDGTTQGWIVAAGGFGTHPAPPVAVASGGPLGDGDGYLRLQSTGTPGPGGKLVVIAGLQWTGDYTLAGVTGIAMNVNNLGATDLSLRLSLSGAYSTNPIVLTAGSGWQQVLFPTAPAALSLAGSVLNVSELRLYHSIAAAEANAGDNIAAVLGVDHITAVPEPSPAWLLLSGLAYGALRLRRS